jgi:hypothetical protein
MIKYQGVADLGRLETLARLFYASIPNDFVSKPKTQFELFAVGLKAGQEGRWFNGVPATPILAARQ